MRLYEELFKNSDVLARYSIVVGGGGYFENVKAVGDFSPQKILVYFPKHGLEIEGENLAIKKYCEGDLELCGKIYKITLITGKTGAAETSNTL